MQYTVFLGWGVACVPAEHLATPHSYDQGLGGLNLGCISGNPGSLGNKVTRKHKILHGPN